MNPHQILVFCTFGAPMSRRFPSCRRIGVGCHQPYSSLLFSQESVIAPLSRARSIHSAPLDSSSLVTILILFLLLSLVLPRGLASSRVIINHAPACVSVPTYAYNMTRPSHPGELVAVLMFSWQRRLSSFSLSSIWGLRSSALLSSA
jgi:hypothetical protein